MSLDTWLRKTITRRNAEDDAIVELESQTPTSSAPKADGKKDKQTRPRDTEPEQEESTKAEPNSTGTAKSAAKKRRINDSWLHDFPWLNFEDGKMFCKVCTEAAEGRKQSKSGNNFVEGASNFQRTALTRHLGSDCHKASCTVIQQRKAMACYQEKQLQQEMSTMSSDSMTAQMSTAVMMALEDIPDRKFPALLKLQKKNGVESLQDEKKWYRRNESCKELQASAAAVCEDKMRQRLMDSPFLGIMLDESLDIAVQKKLVIYFKLLIHGKPHVMFGTNCEVLDGKAVTIVTAVRQYLADMQIPLDKVVGIGTDGANVMIGCNNGVTTVLKRLQPSMVSVWCCAHRLSLMSHWAASQVAALKKVQDTLVAIFNYFKYSAVRYNKLKTLKQIMDEKVKRFKKPTSVRWLSLQDAVIAAEDSWGCLVLTLENAATEKDVTARSLLKEVKTYKFISLLCILRDILDPLMKCSLSFQRDNTDVEEAMNSLESTLEHISSLPDFPGPNLTRLHTSLDQQGQYQNIVFQAGEGQRQTTQNTCKTFSQKIKVEAKRRFPEGDMGILKTLDKVLNPKHLPLQMAEMVQYGNDCLEELCEAFPQVDAQRCKDDYRQFKTLLNNNRGESLETMSIKVLGKSDQFPDFATLASISLVVPITSVPCERAFSLQNAIMNPNRNRLSIKHVKNKMLITNERRLLCTVHAQALKATGSKKQDIEQKLEKLVPYPMSEEFTEASVAHYRSTAQRKK